MKGLASRVNCLMLPVVYIHVTLAFGLLLFHCNFVLTNSSILTGFTRWCKNEGERVVLTDIPDSCYTCICKNRKIECERMPCNPCYLQLTGQMRNCCTACKGCVYNNTAYDSGRKWANPEDPCQILHCESGVITISQQQCFTQCQYPQPPKPGHCCPTCKGCQLRGMTFRDNDEFALEEDRCVRCKCREGNLVCAKQLCPVLACPPSKVIHKNNTCCPECEGKREVFEPKDGCILNDRLYANGYKYRVDSCTTCSCNKSTLICKRETCLPLNCSPELQVLPEGECCAQCKQEEVRTKCSIAGRNYKEGEIWKPNSCTTCECWQGRPRCWIDQCNRLIQCPAGYKVVHPPGGCCPKCVEVEAVCTVFGDPHYWTFDRRFFDYHGSCKYVLAEDCANRSFSVRVKNNARSSRLFSWTKTVFVKVNNTRIVLLQHMKVKVDGRQVNPPYTKQGVLSVLQEEYTVMLKTTLGMTILWDGDGFLEISVPPAYKGKLCGLCGNFNNNSTDDLKTRKGRVVSNPVTFGHSWRIGGKRHCDRMDSATAVEPMLRWDSNAPERKTCNVLHSDTFRPCHDVVNVNLYMRTCMRDMCGCPSGKTCYCGSLTAYAQECARKGVNLNWRNATNCHGPPCRHGSVFNVCGSSCPLTCDNFKSKSKTCPQTKCVRGCHCPSGTVLHKKRCIKPEKCPRNT